MISIEVTTSDEQKTLHYVVIGRTGVLLTETLNFGTDQFIFDIKFNASTWMFPEVQVLIYYIYFTGEIIFDHVTVTFSGSLPNKLNISPSTNSSEPGKWTDFLLKSNPGSTVYLLAVDRSVNLLKTGNDIDEKSVFDDMKAYSVYKNYTKLEIEGSFSDETRYSDVGQINAFMITNAYEGFVYCFDPKTNLTLVANPDDEYELEETLDDEEFESKVRSNFPEVWFFEPVEVNSRGFATLDKLIPDTITSWDITGFALSEKYGLGIAQPQRITVSQKFFLNVHLPYSIRIGEVLKVDVTVFNYFENVKLPLDVDVTIYSDSANEETPEIEFDDAESNNLNSESEFDFYDAKKLTTCEYTRLKLENERRNMTKRIKVAKGSATLTSFFIKATR